MMRLPVVSSLSARLGVAYIVATTTASVQAVSYHSADFPRNAMQLMSDVLNNTAAYENVLDHGCHCARLDQFSNPTIIGGPNVMDALDEICKQWFLMRSCNDSLEGGTCKDLPLSTFSYEVEEVDQEYVCVDPQTDPYAECKSDACTTDIFFAYEIKKYLEDNIAFTPIITPSCPKDQKMDADKTCSGEAPNFAFNNLDRALNVRYSLPELVDLCADAEFDLTVLVDGSGSVRSDDYQTSVDFVTNLIEPFNISPTTGRVTVAQFSSNTQIYTTFDDDLASLTSHIETMKNNQFRQMTYTNEALKAMSDSIISYGRPGVPQFLIVITDGESTNGLEIYDSNTGQYYNTAEKFHQDGVTVFGIGVGYGISQAELQLIATDPDSQYLYELTNFAALDDIRLVIAGNLCAGGGLRSLGDGLPMHHQRPDGPVMFISETKASEEEYKKEMRHME